MNKLDKTSKAYLAGFLDGDGSVYVKISKNDSYKFNYQISSYIAFYQSSVNRKILEIINKILGYGYIRDRKDGVLELIIGDKNSQLIFIKSVLPYCKLKQKQLILMRDILKKKGNIKNANDFLRVCKLVDKFKELNYSKKRTITSVSIEKNIHKIC